MSEGDGPLLILARGRLGFLLQGLHPFDSFFFLLPLFLLLLF
jgi:hypothetical protein